MNDTLQQAVKLHQAGQLAQAKALYLTILKNIPRHVDAHYLLGVLLLQTGETAAAIDHLRKAVRLAPKHPDANYSLGKALLLSGQAREAVKCLGKARALNPANPDAHIELGNAHESLGDNETALQALRGGLAKVPGHPGLMAALGNQLGLMGNHGEAIETFEQLLEVEPDNIVALNGLGNLYLRIGRSLLALDCYDRVLRAEPENAVAKANRSLANLALGNTEAGLKEYDGRFFKAGQGRVGWRDFPVPLWEGEDLKGKRLLVWGEQGLGDELLYFSLLPELIKRGASLSLECDPRLVGLLQRSFPQATVAARPAEGLTGDLHCPGGHIMKRLGDWPDGVTQPKRFIEPDPVRVAEARAWLATLGEGRKIGMAWSSQAPNMGRFKSLPLDLWHPLFDVPGNVFVNLQYGDTDKEITKAKAPIVTPPTLDRFNDIEGLFALVEACDLIITTSNVTAHYAGALGKECWLALGEVGLWYWGKSGEKTLFYPSITVHRQSDTGKWEDVIGAIVGRLVGLGGG